MKLSRVHNRGEGKPTADLSMKYMCVCACRTSENILGQEERTAADEETGGDCQR